MFVCNQETFGYFPVPLRAHNSLKDEADSFMHALLEVNGELARVRPHGGSHRCGLVLNAVVLLPSPGMHFGSSLC